MLDFRHETFLTLCKIRSYTKTAQFLHITQPAVTQHIQYLESFYGGKLFLYENRTLRLTQRGEKLLKVALTMRADSCRLQEQLKQTPEQALHLRFGATLSIGEFVMPKLLAHLLREYPDTQVSMSVNNTQVLLQKLRDGEIDFAFLEGYFDRAQYSAQLFSTESFIAVCGAGHPLCDRKVLLADVLTQRVILRERGSGTREIFEHILAEQNLSINSTRNLCEIGNMSAIKQLVSGNHGVTFLYQAAAKRELESGELVEIKIEKPVTHDFSFVYLKNSLHHEEYQFWLDYFKRIRE